MQKKAMFGRWKIIKLKKNLLALEDKNILQTLLMF